jgi:pimeloyl-ACP methyl ester carboxylesterase
MTGAPDSNLAAAQADLVIALSEGNLVWQRLLQTLMDCGGDILLYRPDRDHYAIQFGALEATRHVAVMVPGVGDDTNLCRDWVPSAHNLFTAAASTTVIMWKGYDNPSSIVAAAIGSVECNEHLRAAGGSLAEFVRCLPLREHHSVTIVAHSFGSLVTGAALADHDLQVTDVVVAGSPGMSVDGLRELHIWSAHFFSEEAPGDAIAELGIFGALPTSPFFGGTHAHQRARPRGGALTFQLLRPGFRGPGEHRQRGDWAVHPGRAPPVEGARDCRRSGVLGDAPPDRASAHVGAAVPGPGFPPHDQCHSFRDFPAARAEEIVRDAVEEAEDVLAWVAQHVGGGPAAT